VEKDVLYNFTFSVKNNKTTKSLLKDINYLYEFLF
jgi:hypothetical protein